MKKVITFLVYAFTAFYSLFFLGILGKLTWLGLKWLVGAL